MLHQTDKHDSYISFFLLTGFVVTVFGSLIALYDLMFDPVHSALSAVAFLVIGFTCLMVGVWRFFQDLDDQLHP